MPTPTIIAAIGDVLAEAEDDPAFAAQMLMPPTESELAAQRTPVDPGRASTPPASALIRAIAAAHGARLAQLYEHMRDAGDFSPGRQGGRTARLAQCLPALSHRRGRRSRGGPGRRALPHRHQHDRHDRGPGGADPHGKPAARRAPSPISMTASAAIRWCWTNGWACRPARPCPKPSTAVRALMKHPAFDIKNPNRVRALIGAFSRQSSALPRCATARLPAGGRGDPHPRSHQSAGGGPHGRRVRKLAAL